MLTLWIATDTHLHMSEEACRLVGHPSLSCLIPYEADKSYTHSFNFSLSLTHTHTFSLSQSISWATPYDYQEISWPPSYLSRARR